MNIFIFPNVKNRIKLRVVKSCKKIFKKYLSYLHLIDKHKNKDIVHLINIEGSKTTRDLQ